MRLPTLPERVGNFDSQHASERRSGLGLLGENPGSRRARRSCKPPGQFLLRDVSILLHGRPAVHLPCLWPTACSAIASRSGWLSIGISVRRIGFIEVQHSSEDPNSGGTLRHAAESRQPVGFDYTLYIRLTLAEPEFRIHLPPAVSVRTIGSSAAQLISNPRHGQLSARRGEPCLYAHDAALGSPARQTQPR
jgi:hypothetical protein